MKKNNFFIVLIVAILALLVLWLRENEMRVRAETRFASIQDKATTVINEKGEAINDLSTQVGEMQAQLQQRTEECTAAITERDMLLAKLNEEAQIAKAEHEAKAAELEATIQENSEKSDASLKKKNAELSEMGEELRKTTERLAAALKEKEQALSESYDLKQRSSTAERKMDKLLDDNRRLEALAKVCVEPTTADGPQGPPTST